MFAIRKMQEDALLKAVAAKSSLDRAKEIVYGKNESDACWVRSAMERLEAGFDPESVIDIRQNCQCGYGMDEKLALLNELKANATTMEEFANAPKARAAGLSFEDGVLYLQFPFCPCPILADVDRLDTKTWCQCTTGYSKVLFEKAFGCPVTVELLKSIKAGDEICLMTIVPENPLLFS